MTDAGAERPLISIVVAVYNNASTIEQCIESVLSQRYPNTELVIVDGGSTDGTLDIVKRYADRLGAWVSEKDDGIYDAWNKGVDLAKGDWIAFLGSDDYLANDTVLESAVPYLVEARKRGIRYVYGRRTQLLRDGSRVVEPGQPWEKAKRTFSDAMSTPHPGSMHHRELFEVHGKFDTSFRISGDYDLLLREVPRRDAMLAPDLEVCVRVDGVSHRMRLAWVKLRELERARARNGYTGVSWELYSRFGRQMGKRALFGTLGQRRGWQLIDLARRLKGGQRRFVPSGQNIQGRDS